MFSLHGKLPTRVPPRAIRPRTAGVQKLGNSSDNGNTGTRGRSSNGSNNMATINARNGRSGNKVSMNTMVSIQASSLGHSKMCVQHLTTFFVEPGHRSS